MIRAIQFPNDFQSVYTCWNRSAHFDHLPDRVFRDKTLDEGILESCTALDEENGRMRGFAIGVLRTRNRELVGHIKFLAVDPAHQRKGVGTALLKKVIRGLQEAGAVSIRVAEAAPNYITPGLDVRYSAALFLLERHGFARIGEAFNMEATIPKEGFILDTPGNFTVRRARSSDKPALRDLLAAEWNAWYAEVDQSLSRQPVAVHVATADDKIVAFSAYEGNNAGLGTFGPMGTLEEARGRGLGVILLKCCLNDLLKMGYTTVIIPWVAPIGFYSKAINASISRVFTRLERRN